MSRIYNFSAGPAMLPEEVLQEAADDMLDYHDSGMSVMEMSHRSKNYDQIIKEAEADLRKLIGIPDNYKVLFLQGGATLGFAMIPMNFMFNGKIDLINSGVWHSRSHTACICRITIYKWTIIIIRCSLPPMGFYEWSYRMTDLCPSASILCWGIIVLQSSYLL